MNFLDTKISDDVNQILRIGDINTDSKRWKIGGVLTFLLLSDLFFLFALCSSLFLSSNRSWKVHWFQKTDRPQWHNKRTNSLSGGSCEATVGNTGVVFDDPSVLSVTGPHAFTSARLSCQPATATHSKSHVHVWAQAPSHNFHGCKLACNLYSYYKL